MHRLLNLIHPVRLPFPPTSDIIRSKRKKRRMDQCIDELIGHSQSGLNPFRPFRPGQNVDEYRSALVLSTAVQLHSRLMELNQLFVARSTYISSLNYSRTAEGKEAARQEFDYSVVKCAGEMLGEREELFDDNVTRDVATCYFGLNVAIGYGIPDRLKRFPLAFDDAEVSAEERVWAVVFARAAVNSFIDQFPACEVMRDAVLQIVSQALGPQIDDDRYESLVLALNEAAAIDDSVVASSMRHCGEVFNSLTSVTGEFDPRMIDALRVAYVIGWKAAQEVWCREA